jgi:hypothetical protein
MGHAVNPYMVRPLVEEEIAVGLREEVAVIYPASH